MQTDNNETLKASEVFKDENALELCSFCEKEEAKKDETLCKTCLDETLMCEHCNERMHQDEARTVFNGRGYDMQYCESCTDNNAFCCEDCNNYFLNDNGYHCSSCDYTYCESDYNENHNHDELVSRLYRNYKDDDKARSDTKGKLNSTRPFGVELEIVAKNTEDARYTLEQLPRSMGITDDGSISGNGVEIQTPILSGVAGEKYLAEVMTKLNAENAFMVNSSCGFHLHIGAEDLVSNAYALKLLFGLYLSFEDVIASFLPRSRRDNNFCRLLKKSFHLQEILNTNTVDDIEKVWYRVEDEMQRKRIKESEKGSDTRYFGINFHILFSRGHYEVRYHSGTVNHDKVFHWVRLHLAVADYVRRVSEVKSTNYGMVLVDTDAYQEAIRECTQSFQITETKEKREKLYTLLDIPKDTRDYFTQRARKFNGQEAEE